MNALELRGAHRDRVRALDIPKLTKDLVKKAGKIGIPEADREDMANIALIALVTKGAGSWDHEADPIGWLFVLRAMTDAWSAEKKRRKRRYAELNTEAVEEAPPSSDPGPARIAMERDSANKLREELLASLANSPLALRVVRLCMEEGALEPAEIAEQLGEPIARIYECKRRIGEHIAKIRAAAVAREQGEEKT